MKNTKLTFLLSLLPALALGGEAKTEAGPEIVVAGKSEFTQWDPAVAFAPSAGSGQDGKGTYLVVWSDGDGNWGGDADIHGVRLKADGSVIDVQPIVICKAKDFQKRPRIAWVEKENNWLVVWQDFRNGKDAALGTCDIYAARVSAEGKVLDPDGIAVCTEKGDQNCPAVASDGQGCLVVWADYRNGEHYAVYGVVVKGGVVSGRPAVMVAGGQGNWRNVAFPSVIWTGKDYMGVAAAAAGCCDHGIGKGSCWMIRVGADGAILKDAAPQLRGVGFPARGTAAAVVPGAGRIMVLAISGGAGKGSYNPSLAYGILMDAEGSPVPQDNPGQTWDTQLVPAPNPSTPICLTAMPNGSDDVWSPAVAASGEWFLCLHQSGVTVRHALIRAKDGHITDQGQLNPAGSRCKTPNAAGGPAGEFLLVYERNDAKEPNQRVCARVVKVKP